jgi:hypothetical protein
MGAANGAELAIAIDLGAAARADHHDLASHRFRGAVSREPFSRR